jgi:hypothetical protein
MLVIKVESVKVVGLVENVKVRKWKVATLRFLLGSIVAALEVVIFHFPLTTPVGKLFESSFAIFR